jgi:flavodoxin
MKTLVVYYSRKGSNKYLAKQISYRLSGDIEAIRPRMNSFFFIMLNLNTGIRRLKSNIAEYQRVVLVGPIFMGRLITPLKSFIKKYNTDFQELVFVTCCGSMDEAKDDKFGHGLVFNEIENMVDGKLTHCRAFPVGLLLPEDQRNDSDAFMKTHLNDSNFQGEIKERFDSFMKTISN